MVEKWYSSAVEEKTKTRWLFSHGIRLWALSRFFYERRNKTGRRCLFVCGIEISNFLMKISIFFFKLCIFYWNFANFWWKSIYSTEISSQKIRYFFLSSLRSPFCCWFQTLLGNKEEYSRLPCKIHAFTPSNWRSCIFFLWWKKYFIFSWNSLKNGILVTHQWWVITSKKRTRKEKYFSSTSSTGAGSSSSMWKNEKPEILENHSKRTAKNPLVTAFCWCCGVKIIRWFKALRQHCGHCIGRMPIISIGIL